MLVSMPCFVYSFGTRHLMTLAVYFPRLFTVSCCLKAQGLYISVSGFRRANCTDF